MRPVGSKGLAALVIVVLGALLAWAGATEGVDSIVYYVFAIVDSIGADPLSLMQPVYNPPPMYTHAYRPLSTALVKLGGWLFGRDVEGLRWLTFAHGLLIIPYGFAARRFLRIHGFGPGIALAGAVGAMLTPTVLFSAWTIPEFDMVGGAIVLFAAAELRLGHAKRSLPLLALAILTKETTAVLMLAYLLAFALWRRERRWWGLTAGYFAALLAAVSPILLVEPPVTHTFNVADEGFAWVRVAFLGFHNLSQVFYVVGPAGAALIGWLGARRLGLPRPTWLMAGLAAAMYALTPLLRHYNHYESVIFSHWWWVLLWCAVAAFGLFALCWRGTLDERIIALAVVLGFGGLLAGPILASFSRADLSARLYAPLVPALHGLAWSAAAIAWSEGRRGMQVAVGLVAASLAWLPVAGAVSAWQFTRARFPVELQGKRDVLAALKEPCPRIFYSNRDQELAVEELELLGDVPPEVRDCALLIQLATTEMGPGSLWDHPLRLFGYDQYRNDFDTDAIETRLRGRLPMNEPIHLYMQHARSTMGPEASAELDADFSWAAERMPETDAGYFDQVVGVVYTEDTPIERFFEEAAPYRTRRSVPFIQLPLWLHELPMRLLRGVPLVETYRYQGALYSIPRGVRPLGEPDGVSHPAEGSDIVHGRSEEPPTP